MNKLILQTTLTPTKHIQIRIKIKQWKIATPDWFTQTVLKNTKFVERTITNIQHKASKTMNLYQGFNEENYSSLNQLQTYIQKFCLWLKNFSRSRRTIFIKPRINRFNLKKTYFVLDRLNKNQKRVQGWEDLCKHGLYWFTHKELHPVSPHSKVKYTKNQFQTITTQQFLKPTRTLQPKLKNLISAHLALQETLSKSD